MAATRALSAAWPLSSRLTEAGRLEVGGCDAVGLAEEFGTPVYLLDEDDLRARARAVRAALEARTADGEVLFASKALPVTAVYRLMAEEGLSIDVASGGELHMALAAGFDPAPHLPPRQRQGRQRAAHRRRRRRGLRRDRQRRRPAAARGDSRPPRPSACSCASTPTSPATPTPPCRPARRDAKFGLALDDAPALLARLRASDAVVLDGLHVHIGSQLLDLAPFARAAAALAPLGDFGTYDLGGGLGVAYRDGDEPPSLEEWVDAVVGAVHDHLGAGKRILLEPGRALVANAGVTLYRVVTVKPGVADRGWRSTAACPTTCARCSTAPATRPRSPTASAAAPACQLAGKHCESGDVLIATADLADPRPGDVVATARHGRVRPRDGQQLQRGAAAAGGASAATATRASSSGARPTTTC